MTTSATPTLTELEQLDADSRESTLKSLTEAQIAELKQKGGFIPLMECRGLSVPEDATPANTSTSIAVLKHDMLASQKKPGGFQTIHKEANGDPADDRLVRLRQHFGKGDAKPGVIPDVSDEQ